MTEALNPRVLTEAETLAWREAAVKVSLQDIVLIFLSFAAGTAGTLVLHPLFTWQPEVLNWNIGIAGGFVGVAVISLMIAARIMINEFALTKDEKEKSFATGSDSHPWSVLRNVTGTWWCNCPPRVGQDGTVYCGGNGVSASGEGCRATQR